MTQKSNPFAPAPETITLNGVSLSVTIPTAKRYFEMVREHGDDGNQISLQLIGECVTFDGVPIDTDKLPLNVFTDLADMLYKKINPDTATGDDDSKK